jgi:hypothetical protein
MRKLFTSCKTQGSRAGKEQGEREGEGGVGGSVGRCRSTRLMNHRL